MAHPQDVLVLARAAIDPKLSHDAMGEFHEYHSRVVSMPGVLSHTLWQSIAWADRCAVLTHFEDEAASIRVMEDMIDGGYLEKATAASMSVPNVKSFLPIVEVGGQVQEFTAGPVMSLSVQVTPPGGLPERLEDLAYLAEVFQSLPGYRGFRLCRGVRVADEVLSLMYWDSVQSFEGSMPKQPLNPVEVFRRLA